MTELSIHTLRGHRFERKGIPFIKCGRSVRYALSDIIGWMESHKVATEEILRGKE